jgi:hypothetical protein
VALALMFWQNAAGAMQHPAGTSIAKTAGHGSAARNAADTSTDPTDTGAPPTTDPPTSDPPTSDPPTSDPPTSDPPTSDPPTSDPPTSDPPTSDPPTSDPPTSDPPTSDPPSSDPPSSPPPPSSSGPTSPSSGPTHGGGGGSSPTHGGGTGHRPHHSAGSQQPSQGGNHSQSGGSGSQQPGGGSSATPQSTPCPTVVPFVTKTASGKPGLPWWSPAATTRANPAVLIKNANHGTTTTSDGRPERLNADGTVSLAEASARDDAEQQKGSAVIGWPAGAGIGAIVVLGIGTAWQLRRRRMGGVA